MKKSFLLSIKLVGITSLVIVWGTLGFSPSASQASAASNSTNTSPDSVCDKTTNPSQCKQHFKTCNQSTAISPEACKNEYLTTVNYGGANPPSESDCNNTANSQQCKSDYEKCGSKNDHATTVCKQKAINDQAIKSVNNPSQGRVNPNASGCSGDSSQCGSTCGSGDDAYTPVIDIGCKGKGNPIADALFGIIRILSDGVGLVVVGSIIVGGIQYSASRGDPQSTAMAINRIRSSLYALLIFIFAYAFLNYLLPGFALQ